MSDVFLAQCNTVPTIVNSEMRISVSTRQIKKLPQWPIAWEGCVEATPAQLRTQWGKPTSGGRIDGFNGFRLGSAANNLTIGTRVTQTTTDAPMADLENQRVGVASLTVGGRFRLKYWNDHGNWKLPISDGGDQGDTAGFQLSYNLGPHGVQTGGWTFQKVDLTMRLATGIPTRGQTKNVGGYDVYTGVRFNDVERGDLNLNATLTKPVLHQRLDVGMTLNSAAIGHFFQNTVVHDKLGIPRFQKSHGRSEVHLYFRLVNNILGG